MRARASWASALLIVVGLWPAAPLPAAEPIATRQMAFRIPFRLSPVPPDAPAPLEVQLYVSPDRGATWSLYSAAGPDETGFAFRAERDGEYWFLVRTKDDTGRLLPEQQPMPELQVVVDTLAPVVELTARRGPAGEVTAQWRTSDSNLRPQTFRIDYQEPSGAAWQSVAIDPSRTQLSASFFAGDVTWWPAASGRLVVKAELADAAGNRTVTQAQVPELLSPDPPESHPLAGPQPQHMAGRGMTPARLATPWPADQTATAPPGTRNDAPQIQFPPAASAGLAATAPPLASAAADASRPIPEPRVLGAGTGGAMPPHRPLGAALQADNAPWGVSSVNAPRWGERPLADVRRGGAPAGVQGPFSLEMLRPGENARMVNSRTFQLEYDVESVGPWGIRKVELWGTRDGGQTWTSYGIDADNRSPLEATIDGEGVWGFRILVQSGNGNMEYPPQSGDRPELWVGVDLTPPGCRLVRVEQGQGPRCGELFIAWEAADQRLAQRPVSLAFSDRPEGPWFTIASGLENTGHYTWQFDNRVPDLFYVRLEVRDEAGNVEYHQTPQPVALERLRPKGRLLEVRPLTPPAATHAAS